METILIIGRVILGFFFIFSGFNHLAKMKSMIQFAEHNNVPMPELAVIVTGLMMMAGGASIIFWAYVPTGIALLVLFLVVTTFWMHRFWTYEGEEKMVQMRYFMGNIALVGALLVIVGMVMTQIFAA